MRLTPQVSKLSSLRLLAALLITSTAVLAHAQNYTSIVVFGDSLSDTGNLADLTQVKYGFRFPGLAFDYADGRFTDGQYTEPAAQKYFGLWVEQLAAMLPAKPPILSSLNGGTNYAYGDATNANSISTVTLETYSVNIHNIGRQITDYLATSPAINNKTLFVVWGGANDVIDATSTNDVIEAAIEQAINIQRLIDAGATQFLIPNLPPLGLVPELNGSAATSVPATTASVLYNDTLKAALAILQDVNLVRHPNLVQLDVFTLFTQIVASPSSFSLTNVTGTSQGIVTIEDPDTYLFWDDLHPTTGGHHILAVTAAAVLAASQCHSLHCK